MRRKKKSASAFRTISEVATLLDVQQHVLRFWETKFAQVKPLKRGGGRRYYRPEDVALLQAIHGLLYTEGYTIKGVQKMLREQGKNAVVRNNQSDAKIPAPVKRVVSATAPMDVSSVQDSAINKSGLNSAQRNALQDVLSDLKDMRAIIDQ